MITISSLSNPLIKEAIRLKKTGERKKRGLMLIDGAREIRAALDSGIRIYKLFVSPELIVSETMHHKVDEHEIVRVPSVIFEKICYKENPDGYLALAFTPAEIKLEAVDIPPDPLYIVLEKIEKPGNLGAILRTAYATGASGLIINDQQTDIYNPNVIRASEGHVFTQPIIRAGTEETINWLAEKKITSVAAATGNNKKYTQADLRRGVAIVLGSEAEGLSEKWLKKADKIVTIPMKRGIDSLNVSVAAAVIIYEAVRQRDKS